MKLIFLIVILCVAMLGSRAEGIDFRQESFEALLKEAKQSNKLLFVDFYTTWCAPCKGMTNKVFPNREVGVFYNEHFISVKLDAEKEGKAVAARYQVSAYPTLVYIDGNGELVHKAVGMRDVEDLIKEGHVALEASRTGTSIAQLKKEYETRKTDEQFLKKYIDKIIEMKEDPTEAIDCFLKVQKEMRLDQFEMMEFLIKHARYFYCSGEGYRIFKANYDNYMAIATRREEVALENMPLIIVMHTKQMAENKKDPDLYAVFMTNWSTLAEKPILHDYNVFRLEYLNLKKDSRGYVNLARVVLDSLIAFETPQQVKARDDKYFQEYCEKTKGHAGILVEGRKEASRQIFSSNVASILQTVGRNYLKMESKKKALKCMTPWIDYGKRVAPENPQLLRLEAACLYKAGRTNEAIFVMESALRIQKPGEKGKGGIEKELELMKNGTFKI